VKLLNIARFASRPHNFAVMAKKVSKRLADAQGSLRQAENYEWLKSNESDPERYARSLDSSLWDEALDYANDLRRHALQTFRMSWEAADFLHCSTSLFV